MVVNRRILYWGVFFLAAGAVMLAAQSVAVSDEDIAAALALWPVLVIALGVGLLLRRTRFGVAGGMLAAAVPGLLIGGVVVAAPRVPDVGLECNGIQPVGFTSREGTFAGAASVDLRAHLRRPHGDDGPRHRLAAPDRRRRERARAVIDASADRLSVASSERERSLRPRPGAPTTGSSRCRPPARWT